MSEAQPHVPVLLPEVLTALAPVAGETHVDGTFGAGGYARALLEAGAEVVAFDRDPDGIAVLPQGEAAGREVAALLGVDGGLAEAAVSVWEDLCILQPDPAGVYVLTAAAVAFPTDWRVADKIGLSIDRVHAPIYGYAEHLSTGVDHFLASTDRT